MHGRFHHSLGYVPSRAYTWLTGGRPTNARRRQPGPGRSDPRHPLAAAAVNCARPRKSPFFVKKKKKKTFLFVPWFFFFFKFYHHYRHHIQHNDIISLLVVGRTLLYAMRINYIHNIYACISDFSGTKIATKVRRVGGNGHCARPTAPATYIYI